MMTPLTPLRLLLPGHLLQSKLSVGAFQDQFLVQVYKGLLEGPILESELPNTKICTKHRFMPSLFDPFYSKGQVRVWAR